MQTGLPGSETARLNALNAYGILDTAAEKSYDDITRLAADICGTPIALISLVDETRQWFKSRVGLAATQIPREHAFCAHTIADPNNLLVVEDASKDPRFASNPWVTDAPAIRFYAGAPIVTANGEVLGTVCVLDQQPRQLGVHALDSLHCLARQVMVQLELRKSLTALEYYQSKLAQINAKLTLQNVIDDLTQLHNRRAFQETLKAEWERTFRYSTPLSLLMIGIDHFKSFNDEFGYLAGDQVLRQVAYVLSGTARLCDMVARYGGEKFAVILPGTDSAGALQIAERIRTRVETETETWLQRGVTVSIGVANYTSQPDTAAILKQVDQALCQAKDQRGNCVVRAS